MVVHNFTVEPELVSGLLEDASVSLQDLAKEMGTYRQAVWRRRMALEEKGVLWGTTAVVSFQKLGWNHYYIFLKERPMTQADLRQVRAVIYRLRQRKNLRMLGSHMLGAGAFSWLVEIAAQNRLEVDRYVEHIKELAGDRLLEEPVVQEVVFSARAGGFVNPMVASMDELAIDSEG